MAKTGYVWDGTQWISFSAPVAAVPNAVGQYSSTQPSNPTTGMLWYDTTVPSMKIYNGSTWVSVSSQVNLSAYAGHISPSVTNTYDLGSASFRWRNIYTQDLNLSNGIGDYTVVEGEENLYLVNNKNGKSFKFALIEVDPSEVPPKSES